VRNYKKIGIEIFKKYRYFEQNQILYVYSFRNDTVIAAVEEYR